MKKDFVIRISPSIYGRLLELKEEWDLARVDYVIKVLLDYYQYDISIVDILPKMAKVYKTKWYAEKKFKCNSYLHKDEVAYPIYVPQRKSKKGGGK